MTDEEKVKAVTYVLTGEFYVGQAVRVNDLGYVGAHWQGREGIVRQIGLSTWGVRVFVDMGEASDGEWICFEPRSLKPL